LGYYIFISRDQWGDDVREKIALDEWKRVVEADPDFELWPGETDVYTLKGCEVHPAFFHSERDGRIWVRCGYFEEVLPKVLEAAAKLGAIVFGEQGEIYRLTEQGAQRPWDELDPPPPEA
jgi:hypothetical protein